MAGTTNTLDPMRFCLMRNKRDERYFYKPSLTLRGHRRLELTGTTNTLDPMRFCLMRNKRDERYFYKPSLTLRGQRSLKDGRNDGIFLQALTNPIRTSQSGIRQERRILWTRCVSVLCATRETNDIFLQALTNPMRTSQSGIKGTVWNMAGTRNDSRPYSLLPLRGATSPH